LAATPVAGEQDVSAGTFVEWQDVFAVIDDGCIPLAQYDVIEAAMRAQAERCGTGIGCLVILPAGATPPADPIKARVTSLLTSLGRDLRCLAYVIEGSGFKAVAVRAALIGMKVFVSAPYPVIVETSMAGALSKMLPYLDQARAAAANLNEVVVAIAEARARGDRAAAPATPLTR
jgi:hypothetical protein